MKKYEVNVYPSGMLPEIVEAEDKIEAQEKMFDMIMDNVDFYLDFVVEEVDDEDE